MECLHDKPSLDLPSYGLQVTLANQTPPWIGSPKELRGVWPELRIHYDPALFAQLKAAGTAARAAGSCNGGRGIDLLRLAPSPASEEVRKLLVPWWMNTKKLLRDQRSNIDGKSAPRGGAPPVTACSCVPGFFPPDCKPLQWPVSSCINSCSGRGSCVAGTCACHAGAHGIDCSDSATVSAGGGDSGSSGTTSAASAEARIGAVSPRIYVYQLPSEFASWLSLPRAAHEAELTRTGGSERSIWWQVTDPMYSADTRLLNRLLASPHRTLQPEKADFFYVPLMLSLGFTSHRFGIYLPSAPAARLIRRAIEYIRSTFPYWNRTDGADHLLPFTGDDGSAWLRGRLPELARAIFVTHWGLQCNDRKLMQRPAHCVRAQLGFRAHRSGQDIVMPPLHSPRTLLPTATWVRNAPEYGPPPLKLGEAAYMLDRSRQYKYLLYFVGKVARHAREGDIYSGGVRQRIYRHHANRSDFYLREKPGGRGSTADMDAMRNSKFCLAPHGTGFGMRQFDAIAHGCVPLIVKVKWSEDAGNGGTLEQPYAEVLPWNALAFYITRAQIPELPELLAAVSPERHWLYRRAAACVWPRLFWMPIPTGSGQHAVDQKVVPQDAKCNAACKAELQRMETHDAFGTFLWLLRERLADRRHRASAGGGVAKREPRGIPGEEVDEEAATKWERIEAGWNHTLVVSASLTEALRSATWITPAASCELALAMDQSGGPTASATAPPPPTARPSPISFGS